MLQVNSSPHAHVGSSVNRIMIEVCVALLPCTAMGFYLFGWPALFLWAITIISALVCDGLCLVLRGKSGMNVLDGSALLTGWLIALTLPPWAPWWIGMCGALFAIAIGKQLYGGVGQNIFNPAMLARVGLLIAFPLQMTTWTNPLPMTGMEYPGFFESLRITFSHRSIADGYSGATALGDLKTSLTMGQAANDMVQQHFLWWQALAGFHPGSMGETSELLVLAGGIWLLARRVIGWELPLSMLGMSALLMAMAKLANPQQFAGAVFNLTSGGIVLGAFFIATDPVTSPISRLGKLFFGAGCAVVIFVIRCWGSFPEAVGFAVLFMNALTPLLDRWCKPRVYGRNLHGKPLAVVHNRAVVDHRREL